MIDEKFTKELKATKNLLAFSAGIDSTALFHILSQNNVPFDAALVNYQARESSFDEENYARVLCNQHNKKLFVKRVKIFGGGFEKKARNIRYDFFEEIIFKYDYETLITAHQLNDWIEWFLMQMCKGAGFFELIGMHRAEKRERYTLARPLLGITKYELIHFLNENGNRAFVDESNTDECFLRNRFRKKYATPLTRDFPAGIKKSFAILQKERERLETKEFLLKYEKLFIIDRFAIDAFHQADIAAKRLGIVMTGIERALLEEEGDFVAGRSVAIAKNDRYIFVSPYVKSVIPKDIRERFRKLGIPHKTRGYIYEARENLLPVLYDMFSARTSTPA
jgi:tRNA(Ile)-lysidine synthase